MKPFLFLFQTYFLTISNRIPVFHSSSASDLRWNITSNRTNVPHLITAGDAPTGEDLGGGGVTAWRPLVARQTYESNVPEWTHEKMALQ